MILLTNDDGYTSPGLRALWRELDREFETMVVAPVRQRSWIGKAISNPGPLTIRQESLDGKSIHVVGDGTPADCVNLALFHLCPQAPQLVISGINLGANFTSSLALSSGTIGAALEAALHNVRGLATNVAFDEAGERALQGDWRDEHVALFEPAARAVATFVRDVLPSIPARARAINLIVPPNLTEPPRFQASFPLPYNYGSVFIRQADETYQNRSVGFLASQAEIAQGSDVWTVRQGVVAYTCYTGILETTGI